MGDIPNELHDEYELYQPMEPEANCPERDEYTPNANDMLISTEVLLPKVDILLAGIVVGHKRDNVVTIYIVAHGPYD